MPYATIKNINFIGKKKSRNILSSLSSSSSSASPSPSTSASPSPLPSPSSNEEISEFFSSLASDLSERIYPNEEFWHQNVPRMQHFFTTAILPELIGKFFSRTTDRSTNSGMDLTPSVPTSYCYCNGPERDAMIGCDNPNCVYKWFHFDCLGLTSEPKSKQWFCPECRRLPKFSRKKKVSTN